MMVMMLVIGIAYIAMLHESNQQEAYLKIRIYTAVGQVATQFGCKVGGNNGAVVISQNKLKTNKK